jgi:hypothetical protein
MAGTRGATDMHDLMEKAQAALQQNAWFEAERLAQRALDVARLAKDFALMARITLPLQEARRQRLQLAWDAESLRIVDEPFGEEIRMEPGCYLVQPPMVGADARRLRLAALDQEVPVAVLCREPMTKLRLCPIVAIGQVTIRTKTDPPKRWDRPTIEWFIGAMEDLGDAAIETLDRGVDAVRQIDALLARLDAWPDHERLHQALADACRAAAAAIAEGRLDPDAVSGGIHEVAIEPDHGLTFAEGPDDDET